MYGGVSQYVVNNKKEYHVRFHNKDCSMDILVMDHNPFGSTELIRSMEDLVKEAYDYLVTQEERTNG